MLDDRNVGPGRVRQQLADRNRSDGLSPAQAMAVAVRKQHGISFAEPGGLAFTHFYPAAAGGDDVEGNDVLGTKRQHPSQLAGVRRHHRPRLAKLGAEEHHAGKVHAVEQIGQRIGRPSRRFEQNLRRSGHGAVPPSSLS